MKTMNNNFKVKKWNNENGEHIKGRCLFCTGMAASPEETYKHLFLKCDHSICRPVEEKYNISAQNLRTKALELYFFPWQGSDLDCSLNVFFKSACFFIIFTTYKTVGLIYGKIWICDQKCKNFAQYFLFFLGTMFPVSTLT